MKNIVLTECHDVIGINENAGDNKTITPSQADELAKFIETQKLKSEYISWGNKSIKFINYVGFIQCSTFSIEILPKVALHNDYNQMRKVLIGMLNDCGYLNVKTSTLSQLKLIDGSLLEIFGRIYASHLFKELTKGIMMEYQQVENNLMMLKGSLIVQKHIKENLSRNKKYMAYCEYEERTINHEINQVFVAANQLLLKNIKDIETQKLLKQIDHMLDRVQPRTFSTKQLTRINLDRINKRFETPLLLAKQFLMNVTASFSVKNHNSFSFLFEMNDLFEKYITALVKQVTKHAVYEQHKEYKLLVNEHNGNDIFQLKPDIVVDKGNTQIIIDTKWKTLTNGNRSGVKREDLFQMYAYLTRYDRAKTAILFYPKQLEFEIDNNEYVQSWYLHADKEKQLRVYGVSLESKNKACQELYKVLHMN
ncbi:McrC family protein (plasmid) [Bacillus cereus]|uniref:McrC family protein n=1 Tax=Bacillus cereus TaxID=1396 RepID=UPI0021CAF3DA|nr:McrC family protein [Bacillus cereus]MCU7756883.1 McrC family protein [Bacillus cereus]MDC7752522.1 McrC family protein [Bacillus cereus]UXP17365.1 McrC family protein [Bacillus cereus]